jgi:hypothetical protein
MLLGIIIAVVNGAALSWDGAVYLFTLLDRQEAFVPHNRLINVALQTPTLLVSQITDDVLILKAVFNLTYTLIPLISLGLSWLVVRNHNRSLFIWPVFGIGIGTLFGQLQFIAEAIIVLQLFWPILLTIAIGFPIRFAFMVVPLSIAIFFGHPYALVLFAFAAAFSLAVAIRQPTRRWPLVAWAIVFAIIDLLAFLRFTFSRTSYESDQMSQESLFWAFSVALNGIPLVALTLSFIAMLIVFLLPYIRNAMYSRILVTVEAVCLLIVLVLVLLWASEAPLWRWANKYTISALFVSLGIMSFAALESLLKHVHQEAYSGVGFVWRHRTQTAHVVGVIFTALITGQSLIWLGLSNELRTTLAQSPNKCLSMAPISWISDTSINHWSTPHYALLLQGNNPEKLVLPDDECGTAPLVEGVKLDRFSFRRWNEGWFDLRPLEQNVRTDRETVSDCTLTLTSGWHRTETNRPTNWWRWSDGRAAQAQIFMPVAEELFLQGRIQSYQEENIVDVLLNGRMIASLTTTRDLEAFTPIRLPLKQGQNLLQFVSRATPVNVDDRLINIAVSNLAVATMTQSSSCLLRQ